MNMYERVLSISQFSQIFLPMKLPCGNTLTWIPRRFILSSGLLYREARGKGQVIKIEPAARPI
jgi:hypothetical protein